MLLFTHAGLMVTGFILMIAGMAVARYFKGKRWWLKAHRRLVLAGFLVMIFGFFAEALQLSFEGSDHFTAPHAYLGVLVFFLLVSVVLAGQSMTGIREIRQSLRVYHTWIGRCALFMIFLNILLGLSMIGLLQRAFFTG